MFLLYFPIIQKILKKSGHVRSLKLPKKVTFAELPGHRALVVGFGVYGGHMCYPPLVNVGVNVVGCRIFFISNDSQLGIFRLRILKPK